MKSTKIEIFIKFKFNIGTYIKPFYASTEPHTKNSSNSMKLYPDETNGLNKTRVNMNRHEQIGATNYLTNSCHWRSPRSVKLVM
jgi:hypothetical protein